jgi:hypothetical protein
MAISFRKNIQKELVHIKIGEEELEYVESIKYLRIIIDEKLELDKKHTRHTKGR